MRIATPALVSILALFVFCFQTPNANAVPDVSGKIVLANLDRYDAQVGQECPTYKFKRGELLDHRSRL